MTCGLRPATGKCRRYLDIKTPMDKGAVMMDELLIKGLAKRTGLEPATTGVTGRYSNQLNYRSVFRTQHCISFLFLVKHYQRI